MVAATTLVGGIAARVASFGIVGTLLIGLVGTLLASLALAVNRWVQLGMPAPDEEGPTDSSPADNETEEEVEYVSDLRSTTETFDLRIAGAFPGQLGLIEVLEPTEAAERLGALLLPTRFRRNERPDDPIWWFRGHSNLPVAAFRDLGNGRCLLNNMELNVRRVVAYRSIDTAYQFVYVESEPDEPVGLYTHTLRSLEERAERRGYAAEEYGLFRGHPITRMEYDDAAAVINGKLVDFTKTPDRAEIRRRFLTKFNFLICAKFHPVNQLGLDRSMEDILNALLRGQGTMKDLVDHIRALPLNRGDRMSLP